MGAYLSQPIKDKETEDGGDETGIRWGAAGMQGWRTGMEDSHLACLDLRAAGTPDSSNSRNTPIAAFAVFDGHGGAEVAKYCAAHICDVVKNTQPFKDGDVGLGLKQSFLRIDDLLRTPAGQAELHALKMASKAGADSDDGEEELVEMDVLSKVNPETHMQIVEQMKRVLRDQFRSKGTLQGGSAMEEDSEGEDDDEEEAEVEEEEGEEEDDDDDYDDDESSVDGDDSKRSGEDGPPQDGISQETIGKADDKSYSNGTVLSVSSTDDSAASPPPSGENSGGSTVRRVPLETAAKSNGIVHEIGATSALTQLKAAPGGAAKCKGLDRGIENGKQSSPDDVEEAVARGKARGERDSEEAAADDAEAMLEVEVDGRAPSGGRGIPSPQALERQAQRRCGFDCGATAVMGLLVGGKTLIVANAGDSRCVVSRKGVAVDMSIDHKPEDEEELARIEKAGGAVVDGRVQGNLNLSRAIGDLMYKSDEDLAPEAQMITANPDLKTLEITDEDEFIVLACDGVWNSLSSQETVDFVRDRLKGTGGSSPLSAICADLCDACCAETADGDGTGLDNVTAVIVSLNTFGAIELIGSGGGNPVAACSSGGEGDASGEMDSSDDGKRKQGGGEGQGGSKGRSGKQMRSAPRAGVQPV